MAVALVNLHRIAVYVDLTFEVALDGGVNASDKEGAAPGIHFRTAAVASSSEAREVYLLSTVEGTFTGHRAQLNGVELLFQGGDLPPLSPRLETGGKMHMPPLTVAFVVLPQAGVAACAA